MMVAATSISEWPASDRIASDPDRTPTTALAIVSAAEATIEPSAAFSFSLMLADSLRDPVSERRKPRQCTGRSRTAVFFRPAGAPPRALRSGGRAVQLAENAFLQHKWLVNTVRLGNTIRRGRGRFGRKCNG